MDVEVPQFQIDQGGPHKEAACKLYEDSTGEFVKLEEPNKSLPHEYSSDFTIRGEQWHHTITEG